MTPALPPREISVLIVDDSPVARRIARMALADLPGCTVAGETASGAEAVSLTRALRPSVVLLDLDLPALPGIEAIGRIMAESPTPIVVMSGHLGGSVDGRPGVIGAEALAAGAVTVLPKPRLADGQDAAAHAEALRRAVSLASRASVITHPRPRPRVPSGEALPVEPVPGTDIQLVVVGASTGGPAAVAAVLTALPPGLAVPVLVVQHMSQGFIAGLAEWLGSNCRLPVSVGYDGQQLLPGTVTVAPDGVNTEVAPGLLLRVVDAPAQQWHVPSVDRAFSSAAEVSGARTVGVLLTGMGRDGACGLRALRDAGGSTLVQDEASSAVWGMPGAAVAAGAAGRVLPLGELGAAVLAATGMTGVSA